MKRMVKSGASVFVAMALVSVAALAQAETRFAVQDATGNTDKMVVTDGGRIGTGKIGTGNETLSPDAALHIKATTYPDSTIKVEGGTGGGGFIALTSFTPTTLPTAGARLGYQYFGAINSAVSPTVSYHATGYYGGAEAAWTTTSTPSFVAFETTPVNTTSRIERLRINSAGNVGVGTNAPTQRLEVNGGIRLNTSTAKPATCTDAQRGVVWLTKGGTGVADALEVCVKDANGNYAWARIN